MCAACVVCNRHVVAGSTALVNIDQERFQEAEYLIREPPECLFEAHSIKHKC